jgi:hypothetical protein
VLRKESPLPSFSHLRGSHWVRRMTKVDEAKAVPRITHKSALLPRFEIGRTATPPRQQSRTFLAHARPHSSRANPEDSNSSTARTDVSKFRRLLYGVRYRVRIAIR